MSKLTRDLHRLKNSQIQPQRLHFQNYHFLVEVTLKQISFINVQS